MNVSRDGGGNMGKDIASREADNLWVRGLPSGLECSAGNVLSRVTNGHKLLACTGTAGTFPRAGADEEAVHCGRGPGLERTGYKL